MNTKTERKTLFYLISLSAILIVGVLASVQLPTNVAAQIECQYGYLKIVFIKGVRQEVCLPPYIVVIDKQRPIPIPDPCLSCPVELLIDPRLFENLKLQPEIAIVQGPGYVNLTASFIPDIRHGSLLGNTTMGPKGFP